MTSKKIDYLVILPVLNEEKILEQSVRTLHAAFDRAWSEGKSWKIMIADNGSTDATSRIGKELQKQYPESVICESFLFRGRGKTLRAIIKSFSSRFYLYSDIDLPISTTDIFKFFTSLEEEKVDIVTAKRRGDRPLERKILSAGVRVVTRILFGLRLSDPQSGVKAFNEKAASLAGRCVENGYFFDTEFLIVARNAHLNIAEVDVEWIEKRYEERKSKINIIRDSWVGFSAMVRIFLRQKQNKH